MIRDITYQIEPDPLTVGLIHVTYYDSDTSILLGGWDGIKLYDEFDALFQKEKSGLIEKFNRRLSETTFLE